MSLDSQDHRTTRLHSDKDNVARHKHLGKPALLHHGVVLSICEENDSAKRHVNGSGEQRWAYQDINGLNDVRHHFPAARL
jgi:hypothetical protein